MALFACLFSTPSFAQSQDGYSKQDFQENRNLITSSPLNSGMDANYMDYRDNNPTAVSGLTDPNKPVVTVDNPLTHVGVNNDVAITVKTSDNLPIANEAVEIIGDNDGSINIKGFTDENGIFRATIIPITHGCIRARVRGYDYAGLISAIYNGESVLRVRLSNYQDPSANNLYLRLQSENMTWGLSCQGNESTIIGKTGTNELLVTFRGDEASYDLFREINLLPDIVNEITFDLSTENLAEANLEFRYLNYPLSYAGIYFERSNTNLLHYTSFLGSPNNIGKRKFYVTPGKYRVSIKRYESSTNLYLVKDNYDLSADKDEVISWNETDVGKLKLNLTAASSALPDRTLILNNDWIWLQDKNELILSKGEYYIDGINLSDSAYGDGNEYTFRKYGESRQKIVIGDTPVEINEDMSIASKNLKVYSNKYYQGNYAYFAAEFYTNSGYKLDYAYDNNLMNVTIKKPNGVSISLGQCSFSRGYYGILSNDPIGIYTIEAAGNLGSVYGSYNLTAIFEVASPTPPNPTSGEGAVTIALKDKNGEYVKNILTYSSTSARSLPGLSTYSDVIYADLGNNKIRITGEGNTSSEAYYIVKDLYVENGKTYNIEVDLNDPQENIVEAVFDFAYDNSPITFADRVIILGKDNAFNASLGATDDTGKKKLFITPGTYTVSIKGKDKNGRYIYLTKNNILINESKNYSISWSKEEVSLLKFDITGAGLSNIQKTIWLENTNGVPADRQIYADINEGNEILVNNGIYNIFEVSLKGNVNGQEFYCDYMADITPIALSLTGGTINYAMDLGIKETAVGSYLNNEMYKLGDKMQFCIDTFTNSGYIILTEDTENLILLKPDGTTVQIAEDCKLYNYLLKYSDPTGKYTLISSIDYGALYGVINSSASFEVEPEYNIGLDKNFIKVGETSQITLTVKNLDGTPAAGKKVAANMNETITDERGSCILNITPSAEGSIVIAVGANQYDNLLFAGSDNMGALNIVITDKEGSSIGDFKAELEGNGIYYLYDSFWNAASKVLPSGNYKLIFTKNSDQDDLCIYTVKDIVITDNMVSKIEFSLNDANEFVEADMQLNNKNNPVVLGEIFIQKYGMEDFEYIGQTNELGQKKLYLTPGIYNIQIRTFDELGPVQLYEEGIDINSSNIYKLSWNIPVISGDANGDNLVSDDDARDVKNKVQYVNQNPPSQEEQMAADVDGDGKLTSTDYALIKRKLAGKITKFPIEIIEEKVAAYEALANGDLSTLEKIDAAKAARPQISLEGLSEANRNSFQARIDAADTKIAIALILIS